ncbi:heparan sulfate 2-O-sulfotransferase pipe-like [Condylostylus longicornis]|uniref:heparan sulfate 2-O-sulfotransferase pipe-like n=1 Tax=Condylostylus longicornis TaxID=2530218 RepID=UPI00244E0D34|nr:heparan sulfate 2-O-sulfotransferase pipe-like [Condylostylus longicornis]
MIYFMRVPKTGSQAMATLIMRYLSKKNEYNVHIGPVKQYGEPFLTAYEQESHIIETLFDIDESKAFIGNHENYIEYASFGFEKPIYISLVRNPIEKVISWFYYSRSNLYKPSNITLFSRRYEKFGGESNWRNKTFDDCIKNFEVECRFIPMNSRKVQGYKRQIIQFCGNYKPCWEFGSPLAVQMAKDNVERNFAVVGTWEDPEITLTVLEHYIPKYFKGALELYKGSY